MAMDKKRHPINSVTVDLFISASTLTFTAALEIYTIMLNVVYMWYLGLPDKSLLAQHHSCRMSITMTWPTLIRPG